MKNFSHGRVIRILSSSKTYAEEQLPTISNFDFEPVDSTKAVKSSRNNSMKKFRKRSDDLSRGKGKLTASFKILVSHQIVSEFIWEGKYIQLLTICFPCYRSNEY
jgi:hypothetical protein